MLHKVERNKIQRRRYLMKKFNRLRAEQRKTRCEYKMKQTGCCSISKLGMSYVNPYIKRQANKY